jgi:hypothetical protein
MMCGEGRPAHESVGRPDPSQRKDHIKEQVVTPAALVVQPHPDRVRVLAAIITATRILLIRGMTKLRFSGREESMPEVINVTLSGGHVSHILSAVFLARSSRSVAAQAS